MSVHSVDELIAYLPYALGYHPSDELVVVGMRGKHMEVSARLPLHAEGAGPQEAPSRAYTAACRGLATMLEVMERNGIDGIHVFAFEDQLGDSDIMQSALDEVLERFAIRLRDIQILRAGRRWSPLSLDVRERVDGISLESQTHSPAVVAGLVRGRAPLTDRQAVTARVQEDPALSGAVATAVESGGLRGRRSDRLWSRVLMPQKGPDRTRGALAGLIPAQVARLLHSLNDVAWRDALIAWAGPGSLPMDKLDPSVRKRLRTHLPAPPEDPWAVLERLMEIARHAPRAHPELVAPICSVVGCVAWQLGQGSTARDAHERALEAVPEHRLSLLGLRLVLFGVRPDVPRPGQALGAVDGTAV